MIEAIEKSRLRHQFDLWAYVIMPEHVHLLVWPRLPGYSISAILGTMKQSVAKRAVAFIQRHAPEFKGVLEDRQPNGKCSYRFWQRGGGYDRNLTSSGVIMATID